MGGSLLMALREMHPGVRLAAWARREEALAELQNRGLADFVSTDARQVAEAAEMAVLCVPVDRLGEVARAMAPAMDARKVVTDVGSVKQPVVGDLEKIFAGHRNFVGSHPMCGSEEAGLTAARADLYQGALCVVTPTADTSDETLSRVESLWESVGGRPRRMSPPEHDRAAALASHVPHVVAAALVELVARGGGAAPELCATGFRDTTRVASGHPGLWAAILESNRQEVTAALRQLADNLQHLGGLLESGQMTGVEKFLSEARQHREKFLNHP